MKLKTFCIVGIGLCLTSFSLAVDPPSWAVGRFRGNNPRYNKSVTVDISRDGDVEVSVQGQSMQRGMWGSRGFSITGMQFYVESGRNSIIVTQANDPKNKATYARIGESNGGNGGWRPPTNNGDVPSWLVGFHSGGRNDYYDADVDLNVERNGNARATVKFDNGRRQTQTGYYRDGYLTLDNVRFNVSSQGRGMTIQQRDQSRNRTVWGGNFGGGGGTWTGGGGNNSGNAPSWAVGDFSGYNRFYDADIDLDITRSGSATATVRHRDGKRQTQRGTVNGNRLTLDGAGFNIRQHGNGITVEQIGNSANWMEYTRDGGGSDNSGGNWGYAPDWLIGTFRGRNALYQAEVEITVSSNGRAEATVTYPDGRRQNQYGGYQGGRLKLDKTWFEVSRSGRGIRVVQVGDRDNDTTYRRS